MSYSITRKTISTLTKKEISDWHFLLSSSASSAQLFLSPEFCTAVHEAQGGVQIVMLREDDCMRLVCPIQREAGIGRLLGAFTQVGLGISDFFDVISDGQENYNLAHILKESGVQSLYYTHAPARVESNSLPVELSDSTYRIVASDSAKNLWEVARKVNLKYWNDAARSLRRIEKEIGPIKFSWHEDSQDIFDILIETKLAQYRATGRVAAPLFQRDVQKTINSLLGNGSELCQGVLSVLRVGDKVLALHLGLKAKAHFHYWFPVYGSAYAKYSPGKVLLMLILQYSKDNGISSFDFGEGTADYKIAAANDSEKLGSGLLKMGILGEISTIPRRLLWRLQ